MCKLRRLSLEEHKNCIFWCARYHRARNKWYPSVFSNKNSICHIYRSMRTKSTYFNSRQIFLPEYGLFLVYDLFLAEWYFINFFTKFFLWTILSGKNQRETFMHNLGVFSIFIEQNRTISNRFSFCPEYFCFHNLWNPPPTSHYTLRFK